VSISTILDDVRRSDRPALRLRLFAVCVALFALALKQAPSQLVGDTKLDLSVDPLRFLGHALHLWDPTGQFGQTQNQGYGYLFPMGPFFALGHLVGLPAWVVQRLWWGTLLSVAFLGMVKLAERLKIGNSFARVLGGLAFALSPRVLSTLGPISVETLPYCLAPWVLVPLVTGSRTGSPRRAAARSGVAILLMGAVNAAAVLAALPPAALWLLTRSGGPRRRALQRWWVLSVVLATSWWVVPLLLLGKYSPPFLDFIENASITTKVTSLVEVLRGTSDWVAFVGGPRGPTWVTGSALLTTPVVVLYTVLVVAAGVAGLLLRDVPERLWLTLCLLLGVVAVTAGHVGPVAGLLAGSERQLLDGVLAPFRNVHKFEVVLRIPLVLGLVHLLGALSAKIPATAPRRTGVALRTAAVATVLGAALPALSVGLAPRAPFQALPGYWWQTATWLHEHRAEGRALLLPGSRFPDYLWGSSNDEPLQALATTQYAVRNAVPLTPPGTIRYLDAIERRLASGMPTFGLADDLARAGVHYLVLRNDLDYGGASTVRPLLVHEAVAGSPGITKVAGFGGEVGGGTAFGYVDEDLEVPYQAVEVYEVRRSTPVAELTPLSDVARVTGGPESLLSLEDRGMLHGRPVVLSTEAEKLPDLEGALTVLTDSLKRREVSFGASLDNSTSATLTADEPFRLAAPAHDYLIPGQPLTIARTFGARQVSASSSGADAGALAGVNRAQTPFAAVDGDPATSWRSDVGQPLEKASWTIRFEGPRPVKGLVLRLDEPVDGPRPSRLRISTDRASTVLPAPPAGQPLVVGGLAGSTSRLTIAVAATTEPGRGFLGLSDVQLPGLVVSRTLVVPAAQGTPVIALDADDSHRRSCYLLIAEYLCSSTIGRAGEEDAGIDRTLQLSAPTLYQVAASAVPRSGPALDALLDAGTGVAVAASSSAITAPAGRPGAVVDGALGTGWRAATGDPDPRLTLTYRSPQAITGLRIGISNSLAASKVRRVRIESAAGTREGAVSSTGYVRFAPMVAASITVHLVADAPATTIDPFSLVRAFLPVGVSELTVIGAVPAVKLAASVTVPCDKGPVLRVGSTLIRSSFTATRAELLQGTAQSLTLCGPAVVALGDSTRVVLSSASAVRPVGLTLRPLAGDAVRAAGSGGLPLSRVTWGNTHRELRVAARGQAALLAVHENANSGWVATLRGQRLAAVTVDGWQQGWVVPVGAAGTVVLAFSPDVTFRRALLAGGLLVVVLLALAVCRGGSALAPASGRAASPVLGLLLLGALGLIGGLWAVGLAAAVTSLQAAVRAGPRREAWSRFRLAAGVAAVMTSGALLALHPWPGSGYMGARMAPQALCVVTLVLVWSALLPGSLRRAPRPTKRSLSFRAGRSTTT
jgi:arabinofuranan 3-O-arabinosyltransferase